jgi:transposase InsO family protein
VAHFIPVKTTYTSARLAKIYMSQIVCLHGVPKSIVSDRGTQFTSHFWHQLHESLGTRLEFSTAFHPQTDGQTKRVNQILEDMLRACALDYGSSWDDNLPYAEFPGCEARNRENTEVCIAFMHRKSGKFLRF